MVTEMVFCFFGNLLYLCIIDLKSYLKTTQIHKSMQDEYLFVLI